MEMSIKKHNRAQWVIPLTAAVIGPCISFVLDFAKDKPVFSTIGEWFAWCWKGLVWLLNFNLKVWWIIVGIAIIALILYIVAITRKPQKRLPDFYEYTTDTFKQFRWTWKWRFNYISQQSEVYDLQAHCPKCDTKLMDGFTREPYNCPRCGFISSYYTEHRNEIERLIIDNLEKNNYPKT